MSKSTEPELSESGSYISVERRAGSFGRVRALRIDVDGRRVGAVRLGETQTFQVAPGDHTVRARMDWCRSRPAHVKLVPDETAQLTCDTFLGHGLLATITLGFMPFPDLQKVR